jgi:hypothetical protein
MIFHTDLRLLLIQPSTACCACASFRVVSCTAPSSLQALLLLGHSGNVETAGTRALALDTFHRIVVAVRCLFARRARGLGLRTAAKRGKRAERSEARTVAPR